MTYASCLAPYGVVVACSVMSACLLICLIRALLVKSFYFGFSPQIDCWQVVISRLIPLVILLLVWNELHTIWPYCINEYVMTS